MSEIKVGQFVRFIENEIYSNIVFIGKVRDIGKEEVVINFKGLDNEMYMAVCCFGENVEILNHKDTLTDLLEVGDIVNIKLLRNELILIVNEVHDDYIIFEDERYSIDKKRNKLLEEELRESSGHDFIITAIELHENRVRQEVGE